MISEKNIGNVLKKLIEENAMALTTVNTVGKPHTIAVAFAKVLGKNKVLLSDHYMKETKRNVSKNKHVSLVVWNKEWKQHFVGYSIKGTATYYSEGKYFEMVRDNKETQAMPTKGAILIDVKSLKRSV